MTQKGTLRGRLRSVVSALGSLRKQSPAAAGSATFRLMYDRFREILALNSAMLDFVADIEEAAAGRSALGKGSLQRRVRKATMDAFVMVKDLNQIARGRHNKLFDTLAALAAQLDSELGPGAAAEGPLTLPLAAGGGAQLVGAKMATLAEAASRCGVRVPEGFVITTVAADRFLAGGELWERCEQLETVLEVAGESALEDACAEIHAAIVATPVPAEVAAAVGAELAGSSWSGDVMLAVRSSAMGEDAAGSSHAGVYRSELRVEQGDLLDAYRRVLASAFAPTAVAYRARYGLAAKDALMAVGCLRMIEARCAGITYSRPPEDPCRDAVIIGAAAGSAAGIVAGEEGGEYLEIAATGEGVASTLLSPVDQRRLRDTARRLEATFGAPQDVEWAIDSADALFVLQTRPVVLVTVPEERADGGGEAPLAVGGRCACPGVGSGPVVKVARGGALADFPHGGVLVARSSDPTFARVMGRCAAIVTDVGLPTGHMASLAREHGVPTIVGLAGATRVLESDRPVTVDATACRVLRGLRPAAGPAPRVAAASGEGAAVAAEVGRIAALVTPLHLTDPTAPEFAPEGCRSLHDIVRFVHERAFEVMFHYGDLAALDRDNSHLLDARLPIVVRIFDLGGGVRSAAENRRRVVGENIVSTPMKAFLAGLLETGIRWDLPRPLSMRGFLSVLGESVAGPPADTLEVGRLSYAIVSDAYMNFSTKAGYHFSTVDSYCGAGQSKNYVHFRFSGGAADAARRERRVAFLSAVLTALDFAVSTRGDVLVARLDKYPEAEVRERLTDLGRLTLCARQLDMLMDSDESPEQFSAAFLAGDWARF